MLCGMLKCDGLQDLPQVAQELRYLSSSRGSLENAQGTCSTSLKGKAGSKPVGPVVHMCRAIHRQSSFKHPRLGTEGVLARVFIFGGQPQGAAC